MGVFIASLDSSESGLNAGLTLITWNCLYGGFYFGRWYEARTISADIVELTESESESEDRRTLGGFDGILITKFTEALLHRFDRKATESHRLWLMVTLLLTPTLFVVIVWILTLYW